MDDYKAIESGKDYLSHHGVKGMKWGIRHDPVPSGEGRRASKKLKKSINSTVRKVAKGLKRASRTSFRAVKRARNRSIQRKIEKAIASGNASKVNKYFSKMSDEQILRAVNRVNKRESILNAKVEDGKRSLKNINMQRKLDSIRLSNDLVRAQRESKSLKHPVFYKNRDTALDSASKTYGSKLGTAMADTTIKEVSNAISKMKNNPNKAEKAVEKAVDKIKKSPDTVTALAKTAANSSKYVDASWRIVHSDFMDIGEDFIAHHGVKGMKWGIRHDEDRISSLKIKKQKNQARLDKARGKKAKFNMKHKSLTARKAEIRMARGKDPGLLGRLALTKSKKLDYKIAKLERKDAKLDEKISASKKKLNTRIETTKKIISDAYRDAAYNAKEDKQVAKQLRDPIRKQELIKEAKEYTKAADYYKNVSVYDIDKLRFKTAKKLANNYRKYDYPLDMIDKGKSW